ncbi:iron-containing alcohol dehydrogenase [Anaerococcus hydrogenalis]|uniref:NADH-dependent alcohol dehydrogenase n=1 Tax=Anaerococcus hydrogenalis TaxID=33029 RepID=A0A2N6UIP0_9FIRM|nr:iron-containing alcohol dehydrogenase [Anaerococcus hydrogenalis]MDK7694866.1 iron-containing alcohol dehydrogenase [Anaerococcus hydrogenalis]MDK7696580.1 iron-containing alcohol dehydrogenase [Anaerococcus hydrogenalis]MDK7707893.1 iron-containing alcohol dehydrogenase [Anaerococcus hydrogenalis]PMC81499.1 NADH-dependent alcohol dehydrogenase [Anaerococcus hydrogenalis]
MLDFTYSIPTKIHFGKDALDFVGEEVKKYSSKVLLTYGGGSIKKNGVYDKVVKELKNSGVEIFELSGIEPNPRIDSVRKGVKIIKENDIGAILAVGGGSTIDASKFMAAGALADFDPWEFISKGKPMSPAIPLLSVLTMAATGSEMDNGGVITNPETKEKLSSGHPDTRPKVSFLNPEITYTVSKYQTACGSSDILSHIFENYFNQYGSMYMLDRMMESLMKTVIKYGPIAMKDPNNYEARTNLMWASSWAINGFISSSSKSQWTVHPIEHELSAFYDITHGLGLAILTPRWMEYVLNETTAHKFYDLGVNVFDIDKDLDQIEVAKKTIEKVKEFFFDTLGLDSNLKEIGIDDKYFDQMSKKACGKKEKIDGFIELSPADVRKIYEMCLED